MIWNEAQSVRPILIRTLTIERKRVVEELLRLQNQIDALVVDYSLNKARRCATHSRTVSGKA
ncbi:MAG: hypothetical protein QOI40_3365, partial [Alphaproteobacteria bacterium]|nr:hypothetical protein [Alphaproteobacteria bacterium]